MGLDIKGSLKYRLYLDTLRYDIAEAAQYAFDFETDPEVCWGVFREYLRKLKKQHVEEYQEYLESDVEEELPESEISKWRRENPQLYKPK